VNETVTPCLAAAGPVGAVEPPPRASRNTATTAITTSTAAADATCRNAAGSRDEGGTPASTLRMIWRSTRSK
jgi:hypothetical protein